MLATPTHRRQARILRWRESPWNNQHPDWLRIDHDLSPSHRDRVVYSRSEVDYAFDPDWIYSLFLVHWIIQVIF